MGDRPQSDSTEQMPQDRAEDVGLGIQGAATAQACCDARLLELIGEFDAGTGWAWFNGILSCAHWLAWACSMSPGTAREHLRVARALRSMPTLAARFANGEFTYSKVRELTRLAGRVDEVELCDLASLQTASQLARTVRSYRAQDGTHLAQVARRRLSWHDTDDGMVRLSVTLLPEEAAVLRGAVDAAVDRQLDTLGTQGMEPSAPGPHEGVPTEAVPTEAVSGDAVPREATIDPVTGLCEVARGYLASSPASFTDDPHLVVVHVDAELLAGTAATDRPAPGRTAPKVPNLPDMSEGSELSELSDLPEVADLPEVLDPPMGPGVGRVPDIPDVPAGTLVQPDVVPPPYDRRLQDGPHPDRPRTAHAWIERGGPIEAATAARHACDATIVGMIIDRHGDILAMGRTRRLASPAQRRALRVRDGSCQFPGCAQHRRLKAHHVVAWAQGGATDLTNLILLCQTHHTYVHEGGVRLTGRPGAWRFVLPDGTTVSSVCPEPSPDRIDEIVRRAAETAAICPDQIFPAGAGEGFRLNECAARLFAIELPTAA
ncbi:DUF222 domain-containing protein [Raineyella sp. LH-20]|uniref:HNH endonuclease signature motif containing protein n=1 Tax=Raineyella sp. LH-20 TaxID=3081204 RepID=UPI002954B360|nr:DUF222 domain-containing protein [Raineyella sp. LH-20]WOP19904.1 DUF222 domain-containing protein [Raineyella sp. LH-20]